MRTLRLLDADAMQLSNELRAYAKLTDGGGHRGRRELRYLFDTAPMLCGVLKSLGVDTDEIVASNSYRRWTKEDLRDLREMYRSGYTDKEAADALGRTVVAVAAQRRKLMEEDAEKEAEKKEADGCDT